jgi:hypothetical protein
MQAWWENRCAGRFFFALPAFGLLERMTICATAATLVIPAHAGIQRAKRKTKLDTGFRRYDGADRYAIVVT